MAGPDETFYDARDWEEEVRILEDKVEEGKRVVREGKKREKSWENEVVELRREWERGRHENIMLKNDVRKLEGEIKAFRSDSVRQRRVQDGLTMRKNALEQEVLDMRSEVVSVDSLHNCCLLWCRFVDLAIRVALSLLRRFANLSSLCWELSVARRSLERSLLRRSLASLCSSDLAGRRSLERPLG